MSLDKFMGSLPKARRFDLAIRLSKLALPLWDEYAAANELNYSDTVVGMFHEVDPLLLKRTIDTVDEHYHSENPNNPAEFIRKLAILQKEFEDPIVALQDDDWQLPDPVRKTFYAVHNLAEALAGNEKTVFGESTIYVSVNQSADALLSSKTKTADEINKILLEFNT